MAEFGQTHDPRASAAEHAGYQVELFEASRMLDYSGQFVPRS